MKRWSTVAMTGILIVAACSSDATQLAASTAPPTESPATTAQQPAPTTAPRTSSPTTTTTPSTTTAVAVETPAPTFLVVNDDGVWQTDLDGTTEQLIDGQVSVAVDDTRGGLLYQLDSGRGWAEGDPSSTAVWWIPAGTDAPQELIVADEAVGRRLTLHDAYATDAGFAVLYTRHDDAEAVDDLVDRLRRIEIPGGAMTELFTQGAWEQGYGDVRSNGSLVSGITYDQVGSACFVRDLDGTGVALPTAAAAPPETSVRGCRLAPDRNELAFSIDDNETVSTTVQVWDLETGEQRHTIEIVDPVGWAIRLESGPGLIVANRSPDGADVSAEVVFLDRPEHPTRWLPIVGHARWRRTPVEIGAPILLAPDTALADEPGV